MTTYNKLPYSNQFERGHSFNWAGRWKAGRYYYNNSYVTDFVVYNNSILVCRRDHLATVELEPQLIISGGQTTDVNSPYWEFVVAVSGDSSYMIQNIIYDDVNKTVTIYYGSDRSETFPFNVTDNSIYIGSDEPTDTDKLWLDTTNSSNVLLKTYNTDRWNVIASTTAYTNAVNAYQKPNTGIPASDLANGVIPDVSNFITKTVNDLVNYYTKSQTYTKAEVQQLISSLSTSTFIIVNSLPTANADTYGLKIYLVPSAEPQSQNVKDEYITIRSGSEGAYTYSWEQIGSTAIDLSDYVTETALATVLENYATKEELPQTLVCGAHAIPQPYSETKDVEETAELFGITEQQVRDLFTGKYKYIQFDGVILTVTVTNNDSSWCVKFQDPFDMTEYTLWGMTIAVGFLMLIGTRLQKDSAVLYTEQSLSTVQKEQARTNIGAESAGNKVTEVNSNSDNTHYPSAKAVWDMLNNMFITLTESEYEQLVSPNSNTYYFTYEEEEGE